MHSPRVALVTGGLLMAVLATACGGSSAGAISPSAGTANGESASAGATGSADDTMTNATVVPRTWADGDPPLSVDPRSSAVLGPAEGGTLTLALTGGPTVTLRVPPGAVTSPTPMALIDRSRGRIHRIVLEPSGLWLHRPAQLSVTGGDPVLVRLGALGDGDLFARAVVGSDGSVPIVRLRPVVVASADVTAAPVPSTPGADMTTVLGSPTAADPLDVRALNDEESAASDTQGGDDESAGAAAAAGMAAAALAPACRDPKSTDAARLVDTRATAGAKAPADLPECLTRAVNIWGQMEIEARADGVVLRGSEGITGRGVVDANADGTTIPLQGQMVGEPGKVSLLLTTLAKGTLNTFGYEGPKITDSACAIGPLAGGSVLASVAELPESKIRLTLNPTPGAFDFTCYGKSMFPAPSQVWDMVRTLKGMAPGDPFVLTFPRNQDSVSVLGSFQNLEGVATKTSDTGTVTVSTNGITMTLGLQVRVVESMKVFEEDDKKWESAEASASRPAASTAAKP